MSKFDLDVLHQTISDTQSNICQAVIVKEGKLIYADTWNGYSINDAVHIASSFKPSVHDRITFIQHNILPYLW